MENSFYDAINRITLDLLESLEYGDTIALNERYALYHYFDDEAVVIVRTDTWDELACVQWNLEKDDLQITEI